MTIKIKAMLVEAHWSTGMVERQNHFLRRAYETVIQNMSSKNLNKNIFLSMNVNAVSDLAVPDSLVPTLLVKDIFSRMTELDSPASSITQRATALRKAMEEIHNLRTN